MRNKPVTFFGLLQAAAIVTVLISVVTGFDFAYYGIELFSHFRLQYLAASLLLLVVFAVSRNPAYAALMLLTTAINSSFVVPWYVDTEANSGSRKLKLLHLNVLTENDEYERLHDLIEAEQPDVLFLQEFSSAWLNATGKMMADYPYRYSQAREDNFGIAMFSRLPLGSVTHIDSPPLNYPTIVATMTIDGDVLTLISTHATVPISPELYDARNIHLGSLADITNEADGAVVLSGDFNASLWDRHYRMLEENTGLKNATRGFGIQPTWPTFLPFAMIPIDHALVSDSIDVIEVRTGSKMGSDHLPLIVTIEL